MSLPFLLLQTGGDRLSLFDYLSLFPPSSLAMPRFSALAEAILRQAADLQALIPSLESGFSVASAAGAHLDALGESMGIPRPSGLTDEAYRQLISVKCTLWSWDGSNESVSTLLSEAIPGAAQVDHCDLSVSVSIPSGTSLPAAPEELFPAPAGVRVILS